MTNPAIVTATAAHLPGIQQIDLYSQRDAQRLAAINTAIDTGLARVLVLGDDVVGYGLVHHQFFEHTFVALLVLREDWRGQGWGPRLLDALVALRVTPRVFTSTNQSNSHMQHVLAKASWQRSGLVDDLDEDDPELIYSLVPPG